MTTELTTDCHCGEPATVFGNGDPVCGQCDVEGSEEFQSWSFERAMLDDGSGRGA